MVCGRLAVSHPGMEKLEFPHDHQVNLQGNRETGVPLFLQNPYKVKTPRVSLLYLSMQVFGWYIGP